MDSVRISLLAAILVGIYVFRADGAAVGTCQWGTANYYLKDDADRLYFYQCTNTGPTKMCCAPGTCVNSTYPVTGGTDNPCVVQNCIGIATTCNLNTATTPAPLPSGATILTPTSSVINVDGITCRVCNFDTDSCNFYQDKTDDFDWTEQAGPTATANTGPPMDQNVATTAGKYYYVESSSPRTAGQKTRMLTPTLTGSTTRCFKFYYHMNGAQMGTLNVYMYLRGTLNQVFTQTGNKGDTWIFAQVPLPAGSYQVVFEGVVGAGDTSDLAIDNVEICKGDCTLSCPTIPPTTPPTTPAPSTAHNLATAGAYTCHFGATTCNDCGFTTDASCTHAWTATKGATDTVGTGPPSDHTGAGCYFYTEATSTNPAEKFCFVTGAFTGDQEKCLTFWYHMYGPHVGTLNVYTRAYGGGDHKIWSKTGDQGNVWKEAKINLPAGEIQLRFEAIRGGASAADHQADIAVDDIQISNTGCPAQADYCTFNPCQNGGTCVSSPTGFTCTCPAGKLGPLCSLNDYCTPNPCQNGGTCQSGVTGYACTCPCGWGGATCTECGCSGGTACWVTIQRRVDGTLDFDKTYAEYAAGFGTETSNYWLGLDALSKMTTTCKWKLEIQLTKWDSSVLTVTYDTFKVDNAANKYKLALSGFNAGTSGLGDAMVVSNGQAFSAKDKDQDGNTSGACAVTYTSGWWFGGCHAANLNGVYPTSSTCQVGGGAPLYCIAWAMPPGTYLNYAFKETLMRITMA